MPHIFCPKGYFGSSCDVFILPQDIHSFEVSPLVANSFELLLGHAVLKLDIPANATATNVTLTIRVYPTRTLQEKPSSELAETLQFSQFIFVVEPYVSFLKEFQVEFRSFHTFVHSDSNVSKISNFLNPSSVAAYQQNEALCFSRSSCQFQIGNLGTKLGGWFPFQVQTTNTTSFKVS